ncbi:MAG: hypothetical protein FRX49_01348, partial [Trebouxia sp. A1-2]
MQRSAVSLLAFSMFVLVDSQGALAIALLAVDNFLIGSKAYPPQLSSLRRLKLWRLVATGNTGKIKDWIDAVYVKKRFYSAEAAASAAMHSPPPSQAHLPRRSISSNASSAGDDVPVMSMAGLLGDVKLKVDPNHILSNAPNGLNLRATSTASSHSHDSPAPNHVTAQLFNILDEPLAESAAAPQLQAAAPSASWDAFADPAESARMYGQQPARPAFQYGQAGAYQHQPASFQQQSGPYQQPQPSRPPGLPHGMSFNGYGQGPPAGMPPTGPSAAFDGPVRQRSHSDATGTGEASAHDPFSGLAPGLGGALPSMPPSRQTSVSSTHSGQDMPGRTAYSSNQGLSQSFGGQQAQPYGGQQAQPYGGQQAQPY